MTIGKNLHTAEPIPEKALQDLTELMQSGDLFRYHAAQNAPVTLLEKEFAEMMGAKYAVAVASCSAALFLSLRALGLGDGDKVIIPGFTFAAVPSAVVHAGCEPVLVEVGENYRMDMDDFATKLTSDIKAVLVSHMRGHTSDMDTLKSACEQAGIPLIEDAAHSLGTTWNGQKIGTIGAVGCFSFQSYKLVNGGEGGIMITNDADIYAQAVIMSGAYENNWKKHQTDANIFAKYQNTLPLYNTRMSNLSAVVIRPQLAEVARRASDGLTNYEYLAAKLNQSEFVTVPDALTGEHRAPDSMQFNLNGFSDADATRFVQTCAGNGLNISIFGLQSENARVFWNWKFLKNLPELPKTRAMLMRACDLRLPAALKREHLDTLAEIILSSLASVKSSQQAAE
ncbi:aminotransferase DegT [Amylibacter ulvae]|uniref:Aminotransferase DegT n=1 Tax=Paramylibacter ulvae TaxID=1651968 RepID=A0ABQ3D2C5_9RHOB|nr:aminotransferase class I/II-fold pyridoxal phosphate-dependent enzyme [Amylibacter ulvae]GHA54846.1 aminotransferase DegT [Amylibacter ulvae]